MTKRQRRLLLIVCAPLLLLVALALVLAALTLSFSPLVSTGGALTDAEVRQVEQWIVDNSPSRFEEQGARDLSLTDEQLNLLSAFALSNIPQLHAISIDFDINGSQADARMSIPRDLGPLTVYLNLRARFAQDKGRARLIELHAGRLTVPRPVMRSAEQIAGYRLAYASTASQELAQVRHSVVSYELSDDMLLLRLEWEPEVLLQLRSQAQQIFVSEEDRKRIIAYHSLINIIAQDAITQRRQVPLHAFIPALYKLAAERSGQPGADAASENRSLLQALSFFVNDLPITQLLGKREGEVLPDNPSMIVMLYQRHDLSRHFVSAAAIAASAGVGIAEVLSNSKEVHDARYGTGFSFSDMTANVAGVTLGETTTADHSTALFMQQKLMKSHSESDYMPEPRTDSDGINEENFIARFGDRTSTVYLNRLQEIEHSVRALPLYKKEETETENTGAF
ncbi:MAG: hypothetical protein Q7W55_14700 [Pseudohongiella sp.]|nr:hypothetical protein [Pseudohongiella sp.]